MTASQDENTLFWDVAAEVMAADDRIFEGTMMSSRCLRINNVKGTSEFLGMPHHTTHGLVVKLPKGRVRELIEGGVAESFAPAGKVFKEWAAVLDSDEARWKALLLESADFLGGSG